MNCKKNSIARKKNAKKTNAKRDNTDSKNLKDLLAIIIVANI